MVAPGLLMTGWLAILQPSVLGGRLKMPHALPALQSDCLAEDDGSRQSVTPVLDLSCHGHEGLLDIGCILGTGLQERDANLVCKSLHTSDSLGAGSQ